MKTTFTQEFNYDFAILDKFNTLCNFVLSKSGKLYNIYDEQLGEFVFEEDLASLELIEIWTEKAYNYFKNEYLENIGIVNNEDFDRQELYLKELELIKKYYLGEEL